MKPPSSAFVNLRPYLSPERVRFFPAGTSKHDALLALAESSASHPAVQDAAVFTQAIFEREELCSTGVGGGIAVPHAKLDSNSGFCISIGIAPQGIDFAAQDAEAVYIIMMIAAPTTQRNTYLQVLATVAARLKDPRVVEGLRSSSTPEAVITYITA